MILEGAMTAIVTPLRDGGVDFNALDRLIEQQLAGGIHGLVAMGTTGESATLNPDEHVSVVAHAVKTVAGRVPVIAGAGANATADAVALSKSCASAGADGLLHVTPYYNKPTQAGLQAHFEALAAATELPIVLYNVPGRTGCDLLPETVARLADNDRIVAVKEATGDLRRAADIVRLCGDAITLLSGDDFTTLPLYAVGGRGVISVVSNVVPDRMAQMWNAASSGDWERAKQLHYSVLPLTELLFIESNPAPTKAALAMLDIIGPEIRLPLVPCTEPLRQRLRAQLETEGLL